MRWEVVMRAFWDHILNISLLIYTMSLPVFFSFLKKIFSKNHYWNLSKDSFALTHKHTLKHNQPKSKWELPWHKHRKNKHIPFILCLCCAYFTFASSKNKDEISASISTRQSTMTALCYRDRLVLMLDTVLVYVFTYSHLLLDLLRLQLQVLMH